MNENKPKIAERIKTLRKEKGLTQEQLADILGLNAKSSIANYENGSNSPSDEIKLKMCELFDCSVDYLMGLTNVKSFRNIVSNTLSDLGIEITNYIPEFANVRNFNLSENEMQFLLNELLFLLQSDKSDIDNDISNRLKKYNIDYSNIKYALFIIEGTARNLKKNKEALNIIQSKLKKHLNKIGRKQFYMTPVYGRISAGQPNWAEECIEGRIPLDPNLMGIVNPEEHFFLRVNGESMNKVVSNGAYALIHKQDVVENGEIAVVLVNGFEATLKKFSKQGDLVILEPMSNDSSFTTQVYGSDTQIKILGKYVGKFEINK